VLPAYRSLLCTAAAAAAAPITGTFTLQLYLGSLLLDPAPPAAAKPFCPGPPLNPELLPWALDPAKGLAGGVLKEVLPFTAVHLPAAAAVALVVFAAAGYLVNVVVQPEPSVADVVVPPPVLNPPPLLVGPAAVGVTAAAAAAAAGSCAFASLTYRMPGTVLLVGSSLGTSVLRLGVYCPPVPVYVGEGGGISVLRLGVR
jgi:hypothetical protein